MIDLSKTTAREYVDLLIQKSQNATGIVVSPTILTIIQMDRKKRFVCLEKIDDTVAFKYLVGHLNDVPVYVNAFYSDNVPAEIIFELPHDISNLLNFGMMA